jgi:hypothetical protein
VTPEGTESSDTLLQLLAPRTDEELVGAAFTTFAFTGRFFEEEVLSTLFGLEVGNGEAYRVASELHESLLGAPVYVWTDERSFTGDRRLGGYDLALVHAPPTFHPKIALTVWASGRGTLETRALIASANLTTEGYRRNAEIVIAATSRSKGDERLLLDAIGYLEEIRATARADDRVEDLLDVARKSIPVGNRPGGRRLLTSRGAPLIDRFFSALTPEERILRAVVVSPFFERTEEAAAASCLREWTRRVFARADANFAGFTFFIPARYRDDVLVTDFPVHVVADSVDPALVETWLVQGVRAVPGYVEPVPRPLHAKVMAVETNRRCLVLAGSANFTNAAFLTGGAAANWEASVLVNLACGASQTLRPPDAVRRALDAIKYEPAQSEPTPPPMIFLEAQLTLASCRLDLFATGRRAPARWELAIDGTIIASGGHGAVGSASLTLDRPPTLPVIEQRMGGAIRHLPITVLDKEHLPLPLSERTPNGEDVLDFFARLRAKGEYDARQADGSSGRGEIEELPPLEHLSRFSRALYGVSDHIARPARSLLEYRARWTGPWGVARINDLLQRRFGDRSDDPSYVLFQLFELRHTLSGVELADDPRCPLAEKETLRDDMLRRLESLRPKVERAMADGPVANVLTSAYEEPDE